MADETRSFNFEGFDRSTAAFMKSPLVTIQGKGTFSLNASAFKALGSPKLVEMFYDKEQRVIGFRGAYDETLKTYPVREQGNTGKTFLIAGAAFLKFFGIPYGEPTRYQAETANGMLIVDLTKEGSPAISNRALAARRRAAQDQEKFSTDSDDVDEDLDDIVNSDGTLRVVGDSG